MRIKFKIWLAKTHRLVVMYRLSCILLVVITSIVLYGIHQTLLPAQTGGVSTQRHLILIGIMSLGLLGFMIPLGYYINGYIRKPLCHLMRVCRQLQQGEIGSTIPDQELIKAPLEIRQLGQTINDMSREAQKSMALLNTTNRILAEAESKYRSLVESAQVGVYYLQNDLIAYINPRFAQFSSYSVQELLGLPYIKVVAPDDRGRIQELANQLLAGEISRLETQFRGIRKDGTFMDAEIYASACEINGAPTIIGTLIDITERKKLASALQKAHAELEQKVAERTRQLYKANQRLQAEIQERLQAERQMQEAKEAVARTEKLASLGTMAGSIAHEINQPLNSIVLIADSLLYWHKWGRLSGSEVVMQDVAAIATQARRIDQIILQTRTLVSNKGIGQPRTLQLNEVIDDSLEMVVERLSLQSISLHTQLQADLPSLLGETTQLETLVTNLLINAAEALATVERDKKEILIRTWSADERLYLAVSDNGPGITRELQEKIFEPFYSTKEKGKNMGFGLAIVQSIVNAHRGTIAVSTNPKGGSIFTVAFPVTGK